MNKGTIVVLCPHTGDRLCRDNKWRSFAHFGTGPTCVKTYKREAAAEKAARKYRRNGPAPGNVVVHLVHLHEGDTMDASGKVTRSYEKGKQS